MTDLPPRPVYGPEAAFRTGVPCEGCRGELWAYATEEEGHHFWCRSCNRRGAWARMARGRRAPRELVREESAGTLAEQAAPMLRNRALLYEMQETAEDILLVIDARYPGQCSRCHASYPAGSRISWATVSKRTFCTSCRPLEVDLTDEGVVEELTA